LFDVNLAPGQRIRIRPDASLKLSQRNGQAVPISDMTGFVNHVEFADGSMWIPERSSIEGTRLKQLLNPSAEEQRLSDMYRRKAHLLQCEIATCSLLESYRFKKNLVSRLAILAGDFRS